MPKYSINFIGCGKLGKVVAKLFTNTPHLEIKGIVNSSMASGLAAVQFIGQGNAYPSIEALPHSDIYFITTPDDKIRNIAEMLTQCATLNKDTILVHCSGALSSDVLESAHAKASQIVSAHPIKSFANPTACLDSFKGTYCAIEGDSIGRDLIKQLFESIGANVFQIEKRYKTLYHSAGVMANNYLVTLHFHAVNCYLASGVEETIAKTLVSMLMQDAFKNLQSLSHEKALTGPLNRGDVRTIASHMEALKQLPLTREIYASLGLGTLPLTHHDEVKKNELSHALIE